VYLYVFCGMDLPAAPARPRRWMRAATRAGDLGEEIRERVAACRAAAAAANVAMVFFSFLSL
jgi:hypothetical protein